MRRTSLRFAWPIAQGGPQAPRKAGHKALKNKGFQKIPDSPLQRFHEQKAGVKRLCRDADTLLSRPGLGAAWRPADRRRTQRQKKSDFREIHASKGSHRA
jgi:hypothetical protein